MIYCIYAERECTYFLFTFYNENFISFLPKLQNIDPNVELDTVPNKKQEHEVNVGE